MKVSADAARRFFVARQLLAPARSLKGRKGVLEVFRRLGSLQFDPIAVAGRSHDIVLHARVAGYKPAWCDELYEEREIFEAFNKSLSFVPAEEYAWFRGTSVRAQKVIDENAAVAKRVLARIRKEGPLSSADFERETGPTKDWFGNSTNAVRAVLEAHMLTGVLGLAWRDGNRRYYDVVERLLPKSVLAKKSPAEQLRHKMLSRYRAHGLLGASGGGDIFQGLGGAATRNATRNELVERGDIVAVDVEGLKGKRYVVREDVALLEDPPSPPPTVAFISPFDPVVWDRTFVHGLFDFHYVWELFLPPAKRRWGWYVLPVLFGDRLVGRIEPRIEREDGRVLVLDAWWENGFVLRKAAGFVDAMHDALDAYLRFAGVERLEWAPHLTTEKKLFATRASRR